MSEEPAPQRSTDGTPEGEQTLEDAILDDETAELIRDSVDGEWLT